MKKTKKLNSRIYKKKYNKFNKTSKNSTSILNSRNSISNSNKKTRYKSASRSRSINDESKSFTIRFTSRKFLSRTHSIIKRGPKPKFKKQNLFLSFINDNINKLRDGKTIYNEKLNKYIFNESAKTCICDNIFKKNVSDECECDNMKKYSSQGLSGSMIYSIKCLEQTNILKVDSMSEYYINMRIETKNYMFIEVDNFTLETLINTYVKQELPNNTVNIINSGICESYKLFFKKKYYGYNLMEEANLGDGYKFFIKLLNGYYDNDFNIIDEDLRYVTITNFLLQSILIIGHLQSSSLEFNHSDYKPDNVFVKKSDKTTLSHFVFNVFGKEIKVKNLGFAVLIADFGKSSITIEDNYNYDNKKYRFISPIKFKPLLKSYVNDIIIKYGDIDPDDIEVKNKNIEIKLEKHIIHKLIPKFFSPTITILRASSVKLYRDIDLYTFFIKLIDNIKIRQYIIDKKLDKTIMSFMSPKFINTLFSINTKNLNMQEVGYMILDILDKINEPMNSVFTNDYIETLKILNYRLFK